MSPPDRTKPGSIHKEDLRSIVEQYMPQESVYHLVERANENGDLIISPQLLYACKRLATKISAAAFLMPISCPGEKLQAYFASFANRSFTCTRTSSVLQKEKRT